jgi:hypothetical protein
VHAPLEHAGKAFATLVVHALGDPNWPLALHDSTLIPEHVF